MPKYKLSYFDIRGLAETSRMLFAAGKQEFEDFRYPFSIEMKDGKPDFASMKRDEFNADQAAGKLDRSMGKVPALEVDGQVICQSKAIERYIAGACGLMGANSVEAAQVDAIGECIRDIRDANGKDTATLPDNLKKLEKALQGTTSGFAVGSKISYADVGIYAMLAQPQGAVDGAAAAMADCPKIKAICDATGENAELKAYIAGRKQTPV